MYHIGKIVEVISPVKDKKIKSSDKSIQAVVRMWDENLMIMGVDPKLSKNLLSGDIGKKIWNEFTKELSRKKSAMAHMQQSQMPPSYR